MPSKSNGSKRKADVPPTGENKAPHTSNSGDATSRRQGMCFATLKYFVSCLLIVPANEHTTDKGIEKGKCFRPYCKNCSSYCTENGEPTGRAVRTNRGQGGHAFQLENALKPITKHQAHNTNEGIPKDIPENAMAPQKSTKNGVN
jgi:hypothetical protein